jgi:hypothetical protein
MIIALILHLLLGVPLCNTEDSSSQPVCVWNAQVQGNHQGRSILWIGEVPIYL